jgi:hypothetical protein
VLPKLLEAGEPDETQLLRERVEELEEELRIEHAKVLEARSHSANASKALMRLRSQFQPWYTTLKMLMGELDGAGVDGSGEVSTPQANAKWESWKRKLGGKQAEFIDALLEHGEMTGAQLKVACKCGQQTVYDTIAKLNKAQLLDKNGGKFSLKEL